MKIPNINKLSKASQLSLLAIVILLGAVFFTVNSALQTQEGSSHASSPIITQIGNYNCYYTGIPIQPINCSYPTPVPVYHAPTPTPPTIFRQPTCSPIPPCKAGFCVQPYTQINCVPGTSSPTPTPTPMPVQNPTPTPGKQTCIIRPTCTPGTACPQYIGVGYCPPTVTVNPTPNPTPTPTPLPVATAVPSTSPSTAPTSVILPTAIPGDTALSLDVGLHGIGTAGDSAAPNTDGNMNPLHPTRTVTVSIYNSQNQQIVSQQGNITYDSASGHFLGSIDLGSQFVTGSYTVKIQTAQYLRGLVSGIQIITAGQTNTLPYIALVAGDINGDNQINILDYNILMGCYSDLLPAVDCTSANQVLADLNDDGNVNQFDYNIFLRELSTVTGD